jgi:pimeloyl-ACP methyl ester carboxylesterase
MLPRYLLALVLSLCPILAHAQAVQTARINTAYGLDVFANRSVTATGPAVDQAVIILHGVRRNAEDYFHIGQQLLAAEHWSDDHTLLLAPGFFTARDTPAGEGLPLWNSRWMEGRPSEQGQVGITPVQALDDLLAWVGDGTRYPTLKQVTLIGHSAGAQLLQRYAVFGLAEQRLAARGIQVRYVISSPSSYLYFDDRRPEGNAFGEEAVAQCPEVNHYRYGLEGVPASLATQPLEARQLFQRYAARHITYLVGMQDNDPKHKLLDTSCGAEAQGDSRLERQRHYLAYERLLGKEWHSPLQRANAEVPGVGHSANDLYASPVVVKLLGLNE